jgi:glycine cleavage system H protein
VSSPPELKYTRDHEWISIAGDVGTVGITDYAQDQLGDIVFVELPAVGAELTQAGKFGEVESVKAVSELYSAISGTVTEANAALVDHPELVNESPYDEGWMIKIRLGDLGELDGLLTAEQYDQYLAQGEG